MNAAEGQGKDVLPGHPAGESKRLAGRSPDSCVIARLRPSRTGSSGIEEQARHLQLRGQFRLTRGVALRIPY